MNVCVCVLYALLHHSSDRHETLGSSHVHTREGFGCFFICYVKQIVNIVWVGGCICEGVRMLYDVLHTAIFRAFLGFILVIGL